MDAKSFITPRQNAELEIAREKIHQKPEQRRTLESLSAEEKVERSAKAARYQKHLDRIVIEWKYPWYHDFKGQNWLPAELVGRNKDVHRQPIATEWLLIDATDAAQNVEMQVRYYEDELVEDYVGPIGGVFNRALPHLAIWARVTDARNEVTSSAVELFEFPSMPRPDSAGGGDIRFMGQSMMHDSPHWEKLGEILDALESQLGTTPQLTMPFSLTGTRAQV
jgi:hypothetical protein